jgi:hypothetical protein
MLGRVAVVLVFRISIALAGVGTRVVKWSEGPGVDAPGHLSKSLLDRLGNAGESDASLSDAVSGETGKVASVATYTGSFETRKLQVSWSFAAAGTPAEDKRVCTFHYLRLAGGAPSAAWVAADFEAAEAAFDTFWTTIATQYLSGTVLNQYRWYKAGPEIAPPQEPVRVVDKSIAGSAATGSPAQLPPQVARSVTEQTSSRKAWGRFYLPAPSHFQVSAASGRFDTTNSTNVINAADTMYETVKAAGIPIVVYSAAKPSRPSAGGGTLPAIGARALTVDQLQVDDIPDVVRSRRHSTAVLKLQRVIS